VPLESAYRLVFPNAKALTMVVRAIDEGKLSLDKSVASYLPEFAANGRGNITVLMLAISYIVSILAGFHSVGGSIVPLESAYRLVFPNAKAPIHYSCQLRNTYAQCDSPHTARRLRRHRPQVHHCEGEAPLIQENRA
jgi:hypothetical protein